MSNATATDHKVELRNHLRDTYLFVYDSFATDPSEVADHVKGVGNTRYARELLGTLVHADLVVISEGGEFGNEHDVWQPSQTHDEIERTEAESIIDKWLDEKMPTTVAKTKSTGSKSRSAKTKNPTGKCLCGCGTNSTSNYRPGHDARHAGQVARRLAEKITPKQATDLLATLPSEALRLKASAMADRIIDKANGKKAKAKDTVSIGEVMDKAKEIYVEEKAKSKEPTAAATKRANAKAPKPTITKATKVGVATSRRRTSTKKAATSAKK